MKYFSNFPLVSYKFGDEIDTALFQNITAYVDVIDQLKDNLSFYEKYTIIDGERPDTLSYKLYGSVEYYWTFWLLNDKIREQGWPLTAQQQYATAKDYYPNKTLVTDETMHGEFYIGDYLATTPFTNPSFKGKIIEKDLNLGQIVVKTSREVRSITVNEGGSGYTTIPTVTIINGGGGGAKAQAVLSGDAVSAIIITDGGDDYDIIPQVKISAPDIPRGTQATATAILSSNNISNNTVVYSQRNQKDTALWDPEEVRVLTVKQVVDQWNSVHHYEDDDGDYIDLPLSQDPGKAIDLTAANSQGYNKVTHLERLQAQTDNLSEIKVFKPAAIGSVVSEFKRLLRQG